MKPKSTADVLKRQAYEAIKAKLAAGGKLTHADYSFIAEMEAQEARRKASAKGGADDSAQLASLDEDLEEWTLRDGVVRGKPRRLYELAAAHKVERRELDRKLWRVQRALLSQYGFEGGARSGPLSGNEALALQWVKSIAQLARASQEWELQMLDLERARASGGGLQIDRFAALVAALKQLADKRDSLALKVRELSVKEKKAGGRNQKAQNFQIVINDDEIA
jgi:hypothetical protein